MAFEIDTGTDHLLATLDEGVLTLSLNRPEARNAMSRELVVALSEQLKEAEQNVDVRCIMLTGAGSAFCAGGDVKNMAQQQKTGRTSTLDEAIHRQRVSQRATAGSLYKIPKPTIAVIPGAAAGAGLSLALACDMRIMSSKAFLTTAFANVGFSGDYGGTLFMSQLIGTAKTRELYFLSERVNSEQCLALGLTNWVEEPDALQANATEIAKRLASGPSIAFRYMKENINRAQASGDIDDCLDLEATHHIHCAATEDHKNAVKAFMEKRKPEFKGL